MANQFWLKKPLAMLLDEVRGEQRLRRVLGPVQLSSLGVGAIIGTGIFVLTGIAAHDRTGPALMLSFVAAGITCIFAALCYAEFASMVPVAGSAYTYAYATLGELFAWIIGWDLILELALAAAVVAVGWSEYLTSLLKSAGLDLPPEIAGENATVFNIPAAAVVLAVTALLVLGVKLSSRVNAIVVAIKLAVVALVIIAGSFFIKAANYTPFIPDSQPTPTVEGLKAPLLQVIAGVSPVAFGWFGILGALAIVFFAYIGFDIVATSAEEARNPQRDLPIGIIASLSICTALYVAVSLVVVGMQKYSELSEGAPLADAFKAVGHPGFATIISVGALCGLTTVVLILLMGQSRVFFAMSRDGLLPGWFSQVHPKYRTPARSTVFIGVIVALMAGKIPLSKLAELVNIGTLFAFIVVAAAVIILRRTRPDLPRSFRTPMVPLVPILAILGCLFVMLNLPVETWIRFIIWMLIGAVVYFLYGRRHSRLQASVGTDHQVVI